jgi:hypothetical protein
MEMKEYLIETFNYNDYANKKVLERSENCRIKMKPFAFSVISSIRKTNG